jgi:cysteine-rich repeat protein
MRRVIPITVGVIALCAAGCGDDSGLPPPGGDGAVADGPQKKDGQHGTDGVAADQHGGETGPKPGCGNGKREGTEQCDDGNKLDLDGCSAACRFEQDHRITAAILQWVTDAHCQHNAFGAAIQPAARTTLQQSLTAGIKQGEMNVLFQWLQLDDLTGKADPAVTLGILSGAKAPGAGYDGTKDLDWWYKADPTTISKTRAPLAQLKGKLAGGVMTVGPGSFTMPLVLAGVKASVKFSHGRISAPVGPPTKPLISSGGAPGHLAGEHLDPTLRSFASAGGTTAGNAGRMCGRIGALSFSKVPVPQEMISGPGACAQGYTAANSMLDVMVGGCTVLLVVPAIKATQPDTEDPTATPAGAGPPYKLTAGAGKKVSGCLDKAAKPVGLNACLADAAYSAYMWYRSGRVIIK